jgi:hypothetical protein
MFNKLRLPYLKVSVLNNRNQALSPATILKSARNRFEKRPVRATSDPQQSCGFCFSGSYASLLASADGKTKLPDAIGLGHLGNAKKVDQPAHPEGGGVIQVRQQLYSPSRLRRAFFMPVCK